MAEKLDSAAKAIFETRRDQQPCLAYPAISGEWEEQPTAVQMRYRNEARAARTALTSQNITIALNLRQRFWMPAYLRVSFALVWLVSWVLSERGVNKLVDAISTFGGRHGFKVSAA